MPAKKKVTAKKTTKTTKKKVERVVKKAPKNQSGFASFVESLRLGESYTSLVLGIIAVVIATILLLTFVHNRQENLPSPDATPTLVQSNSLVISPQPKAETSNVPTPKKDTMSVQKTYTVVAGDNLWKIAVAEYDNGYKWVDIAKANDLVNPGDIHVGNKLIIPQVALSDATVHTADDDMATDYQPHKIVDQTYTVVLGDDLWNIAVRSYGDGYQWVKIAKANNLENPNYIHVGNVLKIPRN